MRISDWSSDVCSSDLARALVASMSRAKDAVRLEREAAEERRSRLEQQASFERARAETQARDAERAQMLDRCLAEFQDDSVQLVTAVSRVSERLHDLSRQAAGQAHSNLGLVANAASGAVQVAENVRSVAFSSGRLVESIAEIRSQTQASQSIVDLAVDEARSAGEQVKLLLHSVDLIRQAASDRGETAPEKNGKTSR